MPASARVTRWMRWRSLAIASLGLALPLAWAGGAAAVPAFEGLGDLPGSFVFSSAARAVSADGSTVVGVSSSTLSNEAFRWTSSSGMLGLGDLPGGNPYSSAWAVSGDGSTVVGESGSSTASIGNGSGVPPEAFRWTSGSGMVGLGDLPGGGFNSTARGVSNDGSVIVGSGKVGFGLEFEAFRWTSGGGMVGLGDLPGGSFESGANAITGDGSVIVGGGSSESGYEAFRWTSGTGMDGLGDLPGGSFASSANGVSADGSTIVGLSISTMGLEAFRWTSGGGMVGLGDLPGGSFESWANGISGDGSRVIGIGSNESGAEPFFWDQTLGMRELDQVLSDLGLGPALAGWTLTNATAISGDGLVIVGTGTNPSGRQEAWRAVIPEPGSALLLGVGLIGMNAVARRRRPRASKAQPTSRTSGGPRGSWLGGPPATP